jgi:hypothetical protein
MFDKKKQTWFTKNFTIKKHVLEMKLKVSFSKHIFGKKYGKRIGFRTTHISRKIYMGLAHAFKFRFFFLNKYLI